MRVQKGKNKRFVLNKGVYTKCPSSQDLYKRFYSIEKNNVVLLDVDVHNQEECMRSFSVRQSMILVVSK